MKWFSTSFNKEIFEIERKLNSFADPFRFKKKNTKNQYPTPFLKKRSDINKIQAIKPAVLI